MKKRWVWLILCLAMLVAGTLSIHACGGGGETPAPASYTIILKGATS